MTLRCEMGDLYYRFFVFSSLRDGPYPENSAGALSFCSRVVPTPRKEGTPYLPLSIAFSKSQGHYYYG